MLVLGWSLNQKTYRQASALLYLIIVGSLAAGTPALAAQPQPADLDKQRQLYKQAKTALAHSDRLRFQGLKQQLQDYPLYPYLEYAYLAVHLRLDSEQRVADFLDTYEGTPPANRLRIRWLNLLKKRDQWQTFLRYYQNTINGTDLACYQAHARYRNGETEAALHAGLSLWLVDKSQPKSCDPLFDLLVKAGRITEKIAWQRYSMAVLSHQYPLARYLERFFVSPHYRTLAANYVSVDRNYQRIGEYDLFKEHGPAVLQVIEHGITHLARRDAQRALTHWNRYLQTHRFDVAAQSRVLSQLVRHLHDQGHGEAADIYLRGRIDLADLNLLEWRLRSAIREGDWQALHTWLAALPKEVREEPLWRYWRVRVSELLGNPLPDSEAIYQSLAGERSYYGFLASQRLHRPYSMQHHPVVIQDSQLEQLANSPAFRRAYELRWHGEELAARREWYAATQDFTEEQWLVAALLAQRWQWHYQAIISMVRASYWNDIDLRFPLAYSELFQAQAKQQNIPYPLLIAIARQESALSPTAQSPAGARGLLQLMPATARQTAKNGNIAYRRTKDLYQPETNIKLGSYYYRTLLNQFNGNRILATAAYNAGPHRVRFWLKKTAGQLPFDAWIEAIPFKETRHYVQNVLAFSVIYAHRLGIEPEMFSDQEKGTLL